jgi:hypothetical protein
LATKPIQENQLKNYIHCSNLYNIDSNYNDLTLSQKLFKQVLNDFYLLVIKDQLTSFDDQLFVIVKTNINKYYPKTLIDESQKLVSYVINGVHSFIKHFPLNKYYPVLTQTSKTHLLDSNELSLNYDLIFVQKNKSKFFHAVVFTSKYNPNYIKSDAFNHLKLKCLSDLYPSRRYTNPATYLHVFNIPDIEFNNKNLKTFPLRKITLSEKEISQPLISSLALYLNELKTPKPFIPKPSCFFTSCPKRKECQNGSNTW